MEKIYNFEVALTGMGGLEKDIENIEFRPVTVTMQDGTEPTLDDVYEMGQNMFQPSDKHRSVSVGDVVLFNGSFHIVADMGFRNLEDYDGMSKRDIRHGYFSLDVDATKQKLADLLTSLKSRHKIGA
jgi:hypothetical protein